MCLAQSHEKVKRNGRKISYLRVYREFQHTQRTTQQTTRETNPNQKL